MIKIFTDTGADFPYVVDDIGKLPLHYYFEDESSIEYGSKINLSMKEFYDGMRKGRVPRTSSVNIEMTIQSFEEELEKGNDIICISLSSGLSGCYVNAVLAVKMLKKKYPDRKMEVIDSTIGSLPMAKMAIDADNMAKNGDNFEEIVRRIDDRKMYYSYEIFLNDLIYPVRGGRVNATIGTASQRLNLKPLIRVDFEGKTVLGTVARGRKRLEDKLINRMLNDGADKVLELGVVHGDNLEEAMMFRDKLLKLGITDDVMVAEIGPVIGSYAGPGSIGLYSKKKVLRK